MSDGGLADIERRLRKDPTDPEALFALGRHFERTRHLPMLLPRAALFERLLAAWATAPDERGPSALFHHLYGVEPVRDAETRSPPYWWRRQGRARAGDGGWYDEELGIPLRIRRPGDGAVMCLVPEGETLFGPEYPAPRPRARRVRVDAFYIDEHSVRHPQYDRYLRATGQWKPDWWLHEAARDERPVDELSWYEAEAYAVWAGGRLPLEVEHEKALRGTGGWMFPWGDHASVLQGVPAKHRRQLEPALPFLPRTDHPLEGRFRAALAAAPDSDRTWELFEALYRDLVASSPFGLVDARDSIRDWCIDWFHPWQGLRVKERNPYQGLPPPHSGRRVLRGGAGERWDRMGPITTRRTEGDPRYPQRPSGVRVVYSLRPDPKRRPTPGGPRAYRVELDADAARGAPDVVSEVRGLFER